jgi:hypothetical protein
MLFWSLRALASLRDSHFIEKPRKPRNMLILNSIFTVNSSGLNNPKVGCMGFGFESDRS